MRFFRPVLTTGVAVCLAGLAACGPTDDAPPAPPSSPRVAVRPLERPVPAPPTDDFESRPVEFDTVPPAPPEPAPRPAPRPAPPRPAPIPRPAPEPEGDGASGSCDVRSTEAFCFSYVGDGWTPAAARDHCRRAPAAAFDGGACPTTDRIATCTFERPDAAGQTLVYTYYAPYPVDLARLACPGAFEAFQ